MKKLVISMLLGAMLAWWLSTADADAPARTDARTGRNADAVRLN